MSLALATATGESFWGISGEMTEKVTWSAVNLEPGLVTVGTVVCHLYRNIISRNKTVSKTKHSLSELLVCLQHTTSIFPCKLISNHHQAWRCSSSRDTAMFADAVWLWAVFLFLFYLNKHFKKLSYSFRFTTLRIYVLIHVDILLQIRVQYGSVCKI